MINLTQITRPPSIAHRIESFNRDAVNVELGAHGEAVIGPLLSPDRCKTLINGYDNEDLYRSRVVMARRGFGRGEYMYFTYPLPSVIAELRESLYPYLAKIANRWNEAMGIDVRYPAGHGVFTANTSSRFKSRSCCRSPARNLQTASSRSPILMQAVIGTCSVSHVRSGQRFTMGVIFHDAK